MSVWLSPPPSPKRLHRSCLSVVAGLFALLVAAPASANPATSYQFDERFRLQRSDDTRPYAREIIAAARAAGVDAELVHALIAVESAYQAHAVSPKGALGLMQLLPETAALYGVRDPLTVAGNLRAGTRHLRELLDRFDNRLDLALAAYNAGEAAVRRHDNAVPPFPETRAYVPAVMTRYRSARPAASARHTPTPINYLPGTRLDARALTRLRDGS